MAFYTDTGQRQYYKEAIVDACDFQSAQEVLVGFCVDLESISLQPTAILAGHSDCVSACAISPNGLVTASASYDNTVKLWNIESGECLRTLKGHRFDLLACAFTPDGLSVISGSVDHTLKLWNIDSSECVMTLKGHEESVTTCAATCDGKGILSGSEDKTLRLWDIESHKCVTSFHGHRREIHDSALTKDFLVSASADKTLKL